MTRNPYARSLRIHAQQVVPDKRDKALRAMWNEEVARGITDDEQALLDALGRAAAFVGSERGECPPVTSDGPDGSTPKPARGSQ